MVLRDEIFKLFCWAFFAIANKKLEIKGTVVQEVHQDDLFCLALNFLPLIKANAGYLICALLVNYRGNVVLDYNNLLFLLSLAFEYTLLVLSYER
jgi:hypothetical protein